MIAAFFMRLIFKKALLGNFDLMNNLFVKSTLMRSKFANSAFLNFNLMNNLLAASKCDHEIETI
jgi:hypothetical protein